MYGCGLNFLTAAALPFSLVYFPMRVRSSGVKEVVYLLAFLHSLSAARLSLPGSSLGVRWETAAFDLPLVGSSWAWPDFARKTFSVRSRATPN